MAPFSIAFGLVLIALGVGGYVSTASKSPTALIPAGFGVLLVVCGLLALKERLRKHAMHLAAMVGLIGFLVPAGMAFPKLPTYFEKGEVLRADGSDATTAVLLQTAMALVCLVFVGLCVNSFIQARRRRAAGS